MSNLCFNGLSIHARHLRKAIGNHLILNDVSLDVLPSEITMLMGPSGCGKTTLLRCLAHLDMPDEGEISLSYQDGAEWAGGPSLHPALTVVFQQLFLWPHLTNRENILLGVKSMMGRDWQGMFARLDESLGLSSFLDRFPNESSLGQRQRTALARALLLRPQVLLLDEVTSALDWETVTKVAGLLLEMKADGMAILCITHDKEFAKSCGDRLNVMEGGRLAAEASFASNSNLL